LNPKNTKTTNVGRIKAIPYDRRIAPRLTTHGNILRLSTDFGKKVHDEDLVSDLLQLPELLADEPERDFQSGVSAGRCRLGRLRDLGMRKHLLRSGDVHDGDTARDVRKVVVEKITEAALPTPRRSCSRSRTASCGGSGSYAPNRTKWSDTPLRTRSGRMSFGFHDTWRSAPSTIRLQPHFEMTALFW